MLNEITSIPDSKLCEAVLEAYQVVFEVADSRSLQPYEEGKQPKPGDYIQTGSTRAGEVYQVVTKANGKLIAIEVIFRKMTPSPDERAPVWYTLMFKEPKKDFNVSNSGNMSVLGYVWSMFRQFYDAHGFDGFSYVPSDDAAGSADQKARLWKILFKKYFPEFVELPQEDPRKVKNYTAFIRKDLI